MTSFAVVSRNHTGKRSGESRPRRIARLIERLTRTVAVWPDVADRASYAARRETATSDECHELESLFQSAAPLS